MKKKKLTATILSTAIGISTVIPAGISEITTYADTPVTFADTNNKLGDVNNDDAVDANDSSIVLEEYSLLSTGKDSNLSDKQKKSADVDKNGEIDASDATIILSYYSYASTGGQLDFEQFIEIMLGNPVQSTTTTTATTTSKTTEKTTTTTSKSTEKTTTTTSKSTEKTTTTTSKSTEKTTTSTSKTTANTTTTTSNPTTTSTTTAISDKVSEIILNSNEINIGIGQSERITDIKVIPQNAVNQEMKWTSSDDSIAIVNNLGWIIGKKAGQCKVIIQSADNPNVFAVIIVNVTDGEQITTSSTSETTTTSSETTTETTSTTVSTETETTVTTTTTTNIKVTGISVTKNSVTLSVGGRDIPFVTMYPENASDKGEIWVSSDENIATVDKYGWIVGKSVGECKVTVYSVSDPSVYAEIEVKVVDEDVPVPEFNFSYVLGDKSDAKTLAFYTPIPKDVSGRFGIDYVITDANGKVTKMSYTIFAPEMNSIVTPLTAETNSFSVSTYITNLETNDTAKIGTYEFSLVPRDAKTIIEDIHYAFYIINGLTN